MVQHVRMGYFFTMVQQTQAKRSKQLVLPCPSPCVKRCGIDMSLRCSGCLRTGREVAAWLEMSDEERWDLLMKVAQRTR